MKRILALICVFAMVLTACACSTTSTVVETSGYSDMDAPGNGGNTVAESGTESGGKSGTESIATGSNSIINNPLKADLKGAKIVVYDPKEKFQPNAATSKSDQALAKVLDKLQKELNCKLVINNADRDKLLQLTVASAAGGKAIGGIITVDLYNSGKYITQNLVANLTKVSSLDLTKDYMNKADVLNSTRFGNGKYGVGISGNSFAVFYNKRILKELGYADNYLYNMVDKGQWTYTQFRKLAKQANKEIDGKSGMSANDRWGCVIQDMGSGMMSDIVVSMGTTMVTNNGGKLKLNMTDSKIVKVAELAQNISSKDGIRYEAGGDDAVKFFSGGNALFLSAYGVKASLLTNMKDEFGILPAPKVDGAKDYSASVDWNYNVMMIPAGLSAKDQYNAGAVMQAYMYLYKNVEEAQKKEYVNRYFCDEKSGANWTITKEYGKSQPNQCYAQYTEALLAGTYRVFWDYVNGKVSSVATAVDSRKSAAQKALDDLNTKIKDK